MADTLSRMFQIYRMSKEDSTFCPFISETEIFNLKSSNMMQLRGCWRMLLINPSVWSLQSMLRVSTYLKHCGDLQLLLSRDSRNTQVSAFVSPLVVCSGKIYRHEFKHKYVFQSKRCCLNICFGEHNKHCNHHNVVIFWPPSGKQEITHLPDQSSCFSIIISLKCVSHHHSDVSFSLCSSR